jgi:hypothetical protein
MNRSEVDPHAWRAQKHSSNQLIVEPSANR